MLIQMSVLSTVNPVCCLMNILHLLTSVLPLFYFVYSCYVHSLSEHVDKRQIQRSLVRNNLAGFKGH